MTTSEATAARPSTRRQRHHPEPARPLPGSPAPPVVGHIPRLRREGMLTMLQRERDEHGDVFALKLGPRPAVVVCHPDAFERVLSGHKRNYCKGRVYDPARLLLGRSLVTLEGDAWRTRRRLAQPYFHRAGLRTLFETMIEVVERNLDDLHRRFPEGGEIDIHHEMIRFTLDVVCTALFGPGVARSDELSPQTLAATVEIMEARLKHPFPLWIPTRTNRRFNRVKAEIDGVIYRIIARARAQRDDQAQRSTLLGMLLETVDEDGRGLTDEEIRDELITLYIAGHETTALMLTWLFALVAGNDQVLPRLAEESDAVLGGSRPTFDDLPQLVYTRQVIDETLRMRSPVPMLSRVSVAEDNLCGYRVPADRMVMLFFWGLHHHPDYWPQPERFDPSRFTPDKVAARDPWAYLPFSGGPRICIGNNFALYEGQLILSMMMQRARWEPVVGQRVEPTSLGTLRPASEVRVRFRWR